jgi:hypothetical protein
LGFGAKPHQAYSFRYMIGYSYKRICAGENKRWRNVKINKPIKPKNFQAYWLIVECNQQLTSLFQE